MPRAKCGFVISHGRDLLHRDVAIIHNESGKIICTGRNPESEDVVLNLNEVDEIYEVVKRQM